MQLTNNKKRIQILKKMTTVGVFFGVWVRVGVRCWLQKTEYLTHVDLKDLSLFIWKEMGQKFILQSSGKLRVLISFLKLD